MSKEFKKFVLIVVAIIVLLYIINRLYLLIEGSIGRLAFMLLSHLIVFVAGYIIGRKVFKKKG